MTLAAAHTSDYLWVFAVVMQRPCVCVCVCEQVVGETYRDDIQDAEEAVDTITWVNLLHHTLFAILETRNTTQIMTKAIRFHRYHSLRS